MNSIGVTAPTVIKGAELHLPSSKSISNRLLILNALAATPANIDNLSDADDTVLLRKLLAENAEEEYCGDGGTTARFLIALRTVQQHLSLIRGSNALQSRPFLPLLNALEQLGAEFEFPQGEGKLPLQIKKGISLGGTVQINGAVSSQFISALMMIAPVLKNGLTIQIEGEAVSKPYLFTTARLMEEFGVFPEFREDSIIIPEACYKAVPVKVGSDWSAAGYWYAFAAALPGSALQLHGLVADNLQADQQVLTWMKVFGVTSEITGSGIRITSEPIQLQSPLQLDFTGCPDLAQTFAVLAAVKSIPLHLTGLSTLKGKETDRIVALQTELNKAGVTTSITENSIQIQRGADPEKIQQSIFNTHNDHRMAMALSLLSVCGTEVRLNEPQVVSKSYPGFWKDLQQCGFTIRA